MSAQERRARLLIAAAKVMARDGVSAGTTRAIVAEAQMPLAAFHYCFHTREDMLRQLIVQLSQTERDAVGAAIGAQDDVDTAVRNGLHAYLDHLVANPGEELVLLELNNYAQRTPALRELAADQYRGYFTSVRQVMEQIAEVSHCRWTMDVDQLARMVVTFLDGITTTWLADRDTEGASQTIDLFADYLVRVAAKPSRRSRRVSPAT